MLSIFVDDDGCGIRPFAHGASLHCITWYFMKLVLSIMAGVHWWSYNGHKPWQTSHPDFGDEIQADCNVKTYIFRCSHHLGHSYSFSITVFCKPSYNSLVGGMGIPMCLTLSLASYTKIFHTLRRRVQVQDRVQQRQLNNVSAHNTARYRIAVYSSLWE